QRQMRLKHRYTPSTSLVLHGLTCSNGPINISYSRIESAPYWSIISSGLTTFPRDFDILCALASTDISVPLTTKSSPSFSTSSLSSFIRSAFSAALEEIHCPFSL